jgi:hypothetical protein
MHMDRKVPKTKTVPAQDIYSKFVVGINALDNRGRLQHHSHVGGKDWWHKEARSGQVVSSEH